MTEKAIRLGKYTLGAQLGSGGFGTVYQATDSIGRVVAVKLLKPGWGDDPGTIERFRREAQVAGELFHNRIATIIDFDEADGRLFIVMRYIDGIPLDKLIQQKGRLEWAQALQILEQVAEGLDYAHRRGFIHRDVKPANILVSEKDGAVLTDFGLVKAADVSGLSTSGVMLGTPAYIAPEIWEGKPAAPQTDIYSLACVAFEMLTGQVLFAGSSPPEIMTRHVLGTPHLSPDLPFGLRNVLQRALAREPFNRYADASAFIADLKKSGGVSPEPASVQGRLNTPSFANSSQQQELFSADHSPVQVELRWQEKTIPVILIIAGIVSTLSMCLFLVFELISAGADPGKWFIAVMLSPFFLLIGLLPVIGGFGLLRRRNWARQLGVAFSGLLEAGSLTGIFCLPLLFTGQMAGDVISAFILFVGLIFFLFAVVVFALFLLNILGGKRMVAWTGGNILLPAKTWQILVFYLTSIFGFGILPAVLMMVRKPAMRRLARAYAIVLMFLCPIIGITLGRNMPDDGSGYILIGYTVTFLAVLLAIGLSLYSFSSLNSPEIRAYYENREA